MTTVVKVYSAHDVSYFIDGVRADVYDDYGILQEVLGENFKEYWLPSKAILGQQDRELLAALEETDFLDEFEALSSVNPRLVADDVW